MVDEATSAGAETASVCPWCSAALPDPDAATCPSCGAKLNGGVDEPVPGLTAVDPVAIVRSKQPVRQRSRLLSWLSGDEGDEQFTPAEGDALAPPDLEVRREMLRLELEAEVAQLQAENDAILAEAAAEGRVVEMPPAVPADADAGMDETDPTASGSGEPPVSGADAAPPAADEASPTA